MSLRDIYLVSELVEISPMENRRGTKKRQLTGFQRCTSPFAPIWIGEWSLVKEMRTSIGHQNTALAQDLDYDGEETKNVKSSKKEAAEFCDKVFQ